MNGTIRYPLVRYPFLRKVSSAALSRVDAQGLFVVKDNINIHLNLTFYINNT